MHIVAYCNEVKNINLLVRQKRKKEDVTLK